MGGVPFEPAGDVVAGVLFHVVAEDLVGFFLEGEGVAGLALVAGDVGFAAVHEDVAVGDDLAGGPDGAADAESAADVVEAELEDLWPCPCSGGIVFPSRRSGSGAFAFR